jgi:hypothetical protein
MLPSMIPSVVTHVGDGVGPDARECTPFVLVAGHASRAFGAGHSVRVMKLVCPSVVWHGNAADPPPGW